MNTEYNIVPRLRAMGWQGPDEEAPICAQAISAVLKHFLTPNKSLREHSDGAQEFRINAADLKQELELIRTCISHDKHVYVEAYGLLRGFAPLANLGPTAAYCKSWKSLDVFKKYGVPLPKLSITNFGKRDGFDNVYAEEIIKIYPPSIIETILEAAAHFHIHPNQSEFLAHLIRISPDVNKFNSEGRTLLYIAVAVNNFAMANLLLANGANPNAQTALREKTPIAGARTPEMINLLLREGAKPSLPYTERGTHFPNGVPTNFPYYALLHEKTAMHRLK